MEATTNNQHTLRTTRQCQRHLGIPHGVSRSHHSTRSSRKALNCTSIHTDSESAYKLIRHPKRIQASSHAPLVRILQRYLPTTRNLVQHIYSRNEQLTKDKSKWTHEMYGNHLADRAAANDGSSLEPFDHIAISDLKSSPTDPTHKTTLNCN